MKRQIPTLFVKEIVYFLNTLSNAKTLHGRFMPVTLALCLSMLTIQSVFGSEANEVPGSLITSVGSVDVTPNPVTYGTLKEAFDAINLGTHTGAITITITASTGEVASALLNASGIGAASYTSILIQPGAGLAVSVTGTIAGALIDLNGADNVTINGVNAGSSLIIDNASTGAASAIRFIGDASNNTIQNCTILGSASTASNGVVIFSTGNATGNDGNNINNCQIRASGANLPINCVFSLGTSAIIDNSGNILNQNNISDYFNAASTSTGINLGNFGNSAWTITNNRLYQSAQRIYTTSNTHSGISIGVGSSYNITGNTIGFANSSGTGMTMMVGNSVALSGTFPSAWNNTGTANATRYIAINCEFTAGGAVSSIQNNTMAGFALYTNSGAATTNGIWCGINVTSGNVNIGTITGNTIGATSGQGAVYAACNTAGGAAVGIFVTSANKVNIQNNTIGAIDAAGAVVASGCGGITGIDVAGAGNYTIFNNIIGNSTADNLRAGNLATGATLSNTGTFVTTSGVGACVGIRSSATGGPLDIEQNTLRGFAMSSTSSSTSSTFTGITNTGTATAAVFINNNLLGTASVGLVKYYFAIGASSALTGINCSGGNPSAPFTITNNDIRGIVYTVAGANSHTYITWSHFTSGTDNINNNTFTNLNLNTTGSVTFLTRSSAMSAPGTENVNSNTIVTAFNKGGAGGTVTFFGANSASTNGTFMTNNLNNFSNVTVPGSTNIAGWSNTEGFSATSGPQKTITNNTFNNITANTTPTGAMTIMNVNVSGSNTVVSSNTISNVTGGAAITALTLGSSNQSLTVAQNLIDPITSSGAGAVTGISSASLFVTMSKNKIYDLGGTNAATTVNGILVTGSGITTIVNNLIGNLTASAANTADAIRGISITSNSAPSVINVYYNTIYLNASSSASPFGTTGIFHTVNTTPTTAALNMINNIIVNTSTPAGAGLTVAYRRSAGAAGNLANYTSTSGNNLFYAGTPSASRLIYSDGVAAAQTITDYRNGVFGAGTIAPRDMSSVSENLTATFLSTTGSSPNFLHINTINPTQVESAGTAIAGVTDDFDGNGRNASTPDIGADEGPFIPSDLTGPSISYTPLTGNSCTTGKTFAAAIVDGTGVNTAAMMKPRVYYRKSTNSNTFNNNTSGTDGWKYVEASNASSPFNFTFNYTLLFGGGGVAGGDIIEYVIVAQDLAGTPNFSANTGIFTTPPTGVALVGGNFPVTSAPSFTIQATAGPGGTLSLGAAETFHSLTETGAFGLFNAINTNGLSDNLTLTVSDASVTETGAIPLNAINYTGCSTGPYTLTIKPATTNTLTGSVANGALIKLNGADFVTIDGSNNGSSSRDLTITNSNTTSPAAIWIASTGLLTGADHNTIKNCNINTGSNAGFSFGIAIAGATLGSGGADNDNITIQNNFITKAYHGIWANGTAVLTNGALDNLIITGNTIGPVSAGADNIGFSGINLANSIAPLVTSNTVQNIVTTAQTASGILIASTVAGVTITQNTVQNLNSSFNGINFSGISVNGLSGANPFTISGNTVSNIVQTIPSLVTGLILSVPCIVEKNNISGIINTSTTSSGAFGIDVNGGNGQLIRNNFISNVTGDMTSGGAFSFNFGIFGIRIITGTSHKIYHNSINLYGLRTGSANSSLLSAAICIANPFSTDCDIRNNLLSNTMTGGTTSIAYVDLYLPTSGVPGMNLTLNNNAYFTGNTAGVHGVAHVGTTYITPPAGPATYAGLYTVVNFNPNSTSGTTNFRNYSSNLLASGVSNDNLSFAFETAAPFSSNVNLHIPAATNGQLESGGASVGVTTDIDMDTRPGPAGSVNGGASAPDVGADEFDGVPAAPMAYFSSTTTQNNTSTIATNSTHQEVIGIQIVTTGVLIPLHATKFTVNTTGTTSTSDIANAKIFYTGNSSVFGTTQQFGSTVASPSGSFNILGNVILSTGTNYFWLTYDVPCGSIPANVVDAQCTSLTAGGIFSPTVTDPAGNRSIIVGPLSGSRTVGGAMPNYTTLTDAIADINLKGLGGNTTLLIQGNTTEPGAIVINQWQDCGGSNFKLTIKPAPATTPTITANSATAVIILNGADRVIIDGSNGSVVNSVCPVSTATRDLTIINTNTGTASAVVWLQTAGGNSATNDTVRNCVLVGNSNTTTLFGLGSGSSIISTTSLGTTNNNNGFINNNISRTQYGIYSQGASAGTKNTGNFITQNLINTAANNNVQIGGIWVGFENNITVSGNTISGIMTSTDCFGISIGLGDSFVTTTTVGNEVTNAIVKNNIVSSVVSTSTTGFTALGIGIGAQPIGSTTLVANNMIGGILSFATPGDFIAGIHVGGGAGTTQVYYNTISLTGSKSSGTTGGTSPSYALSIAGTTPVVDNRNNILINSQTSANATPGKSFAIGLAYTSTLGNYANLVSNNNDFFVSGAQGVLCKVGSLSQGSGTEKSTLAAWTTETGRDGGGTTLNLMPVFLSATDLHLDSGDLTNSPFDNGAVSIGAVTNDIDCEVRMTDIGADEITFVTGIDMRAVTLVAPAAIGCYTASEIVTVTVKNSSLNPIDFSVNNLTVTVTATGGYSSNVVLTSGILAPNSSQNVTMPANINMSGPGSYTFNANTSVVGDVVPGNNAMAPVIRIKSSLGGTYPLGVGQSGFGGYETLTAAVNAYNNVTCITGPIVFNLIDASFAGGETYPIVINANPAAGAFTLTIRPASGAVTLGGVSSSSIIKLNGADRVVIDGINSGGTSLTITNTLLTSPTAIIWIASAGPSDGATFDTIRNCNLVGATNLTTTAGVVTGSGITLGDPAEAPNSNNAIIRNKIYRVTNGIFSNGATTLDQNWFFSNNTIGSTVAGDKPAIRGFGIGNVQNFTVTGNTVTGVVSTETSSVTMSGIQIFGTVNGGTISNNKLSDIKQINNAGWGSNGIMLGASTTASAMNVFDNFIFDVASYGYPNITYEDNAYGIMIASGGGYNVYHNTVNMNTNQTATDGAPAAINISSDVTTPGSIDLRNNIFVNNMTVGTQRYSIISGAANTVFSNIDYNDYGTGGANLGFIGGFDRLDLAAIQAGFGGNLNSENIQPIFVSATDPHINSAASIALDNQGTPAPIAGVPNDIDGTPWNSPVDMGADEFTGCNLTVSNTNNSGAGSLRDVIGCAFSGATVNASMLPALSTINLGTEILINKDLTLNGPGVINLTVSGGGASRIFNLAAGKNLTIQNMSLKNGFSPANGGAIYVAGNLTLNNVLLQNNFSGPQPSPWTLIPPGTATVIGNVEVKN